MIHFVKIFLGGFFMSVYRLICMKLPNVATSISWQKKIAHQLITLEWITLAISFTLFAIGTNLKGFDPSLPNCKNDDSERYGNSWYRDLKCAIKITPEGFLRLLNSVRNIAYSKCNVSFQPSSKDKLQATKLLVRKSWLSKVVSVLFVCLF